ncbi:hypothetical protein EDEG_01458 [Edhazardia aedis USNM 41457]|uniref:Uncharacterized protein n=1 Tax=Edhazardia aedis (strain USNM 41457) TaxID=1003232 RepID=J9D919_EDHAE|nr:hypothetical protein EDEG_01458 [Edhazardia aedis USNM 41457]|eukprot:EJW04266.1 hypothetical protein EDEG_01458 [Edhazardia aedis USNM 41457]
MKISFNFIFEVMLALCLAFFKIYQLIKLEMFYHSLSNQTLSDNENSNLNFMNSNTEMPYSTNLETENVLLNNTKITDVIGYQEVDVQDMCDENFLNNTIKDDKFSIKIDKCLEALQPHCNDKTNNWLRNSTQILNLLKHLGHFDADENVKNFQVVSGKQKKCDANAFLNIIKIIDPNTKNIPSSDAYLYVRKIKNVVEVFKNYIFCLDTLYLDNYSWLKVDNMTGKLGEVCNINEYSDTKLLILQMTTYISTNDCLYHFYHFKTDCGSSEFKKLLKICFKYVFNKNAKILYKENNLAKIKLGWFDKRDVVEIDKKNNCSLNENKKNNCSLSENSYKRFYNNLLQNCKLFSKISSSKTNKNANEQLCIHNKGIVIKNKNRIFNLYFTKKDHLNPIKLFCEKIDDSNKPINGTKIQHNVTKNIKDISENLSKLEMTEIIAYKDAKYIYHLLRENYMIYNEQQQNIIAQLYLNIFLDSQFCKVFEEIVFSAENYKANILNAKLENFDLIDSEEQKNATVPYLNNFYVKKIYKHPRMPKEGCENKGNPS